MAVPSYINRFPVKQIPLTTVPLPLLIHGFVGFFLFYIILDFVTRFFKFLSQSNSHAENKKMSQNVSSFREILTDESLRKEDVEIVMSKLGIFCQHEGDLGNICEIFDEEEFKIQHLREAFGVFDENKDGFIDERELQRVLLALGLEKDASLDNCKKMIMAFDENGDGRIEFEEFVKLV